MALVGSALFHAAVLGGLSLKMAPSTHGRAEAPAMNVGLVDPPPFVRAPLSPTDRTATPPLVRVVASESEPRYVGPAQAATGEASDATDLFGPVFADGQWPRPVLVRSEPCDAHDPTPRGDQCRRELLLIGLASQAQPGSNPRP